jgi:sugar phosphate isomerase/epimerase
MTQPLHRRDLLSCAAAIAAGLATSATATRPGFADEPPSRPAQEPFGYCLNTSTIRDARLPLPEVVDLAAKAGWQALELWVGDIQRYAEEGGSLPDLKKRIAGVGLTVESAIAFAPWIVDDDAARKAGFEQAKREMELVGQIGGTRIAAPPAGATDQADLNLDKAAERYRALLELGDSLGVVPQLEVWGFSKALGRLSEVMYVAAEARHERACLLPDIYHLHRGGSGFSGLRMLSGQAVHVIHVNDYPTASREALRDADRIYPGDGVAPLGQIFRDMHAAGFRGMLSLELFNPEYGKQDPLTVARTGLEKTRVAVLSAFDA